MSTPTRPGALSAFLTTHPTTENYWRGIVLLGRNVASYKLALAKSLLDLSTAGATFVTLEELAIPYTTHLIEHLEQSPKQITSSSSKFLDACRKFHEGNLTQTHLVGVAVKLGFNNVIDAFHVVNQAQIPCKFFVDERETCKGITLTDTLLNLATTVQATNLPSEVEARWRLVETAWSLSLPPSLLAIQYDAELESLFVEIPSARIDVTGCREALNGYQKGKCFYCFRDILIPRGPDSNVDVDHFLPLGLSQFSEFVKVNLNGVWNLVLACADCNRGVRGKFMRVPATRYLERLHCRNQFYIESHHPLRETLMNQTGQEESQRRDFLQQLHVAATNRLLHAWEAADEHAPAF